MLMSLLNSNNTKSVNYNLKGRIVHSLYEDIFYK